MATNTFSRDGAPTEADYDIEIEVREAFAKYDPLRMFGDALHIIARGGNVILNGPVRSHSARENAAQLAAKVNGVTKVENNLVVDTDLEVLVAQALAADPRTQVLFPGVLVGVVFGVAYLKGEAPSAQVKQAAAEVAAKVPGVVAVSNDLSTPPDLKGSAKPLAAERTMAGASPQTKTGNPQG